MGQVNWIRQLVLSLVLFSLGTVAYWYEYKHKPQAEEHEEQAKRLFQINALPVTTVQMSKGTATYQFTCLDKATKLCKPSDQSRWELNLPRKLKADDRNVNQLLTAAERLTPTDTLSMKEETPEKRASLMKAYGLDPESLKTAQKIQVQTDKGTHVLYLGQPHPIGESLFAAEETVPPGQQPSGKIDEMHVYLVPQSFRASLDHDLSYWRDKKLSTLASHEIQSFKLEGSKGKLLAERTKGQKEGAEDGQWEIKSKDTTGEAVKGDHDRIEQFLSSLTQLNAKAVASEDKHDAHAKKLLKGYLPSLSILLQPEAQATAPVTYTFFQKLPPQPGSTVYATVSNLDPLFELEGNAISQLNKDLKDLRQTKLLNSRERLAVHRIEISGKPVGNPPVILSEKEGKWRDESDSSEVEGERVQHLLDKLSTSPIRDFLSEKSIPKGEQDGLVIQIEEEKDKPLQKLVFWKKDQTVYVRDLQSHRKEAFSLDASFQDPLPWNRKFFKKIETMSPPSESKKLPELKK